MINILKYLAFRFRREKWITWSTKGAYGMELELAHLSDEEALNKLGVFSQQEE